VQVEGSLNTYTMKKWGVDGLGGDVFGVGIEGTFQAIKTHDDPPAVEFSKISGTEYATRFAKNLEAAKQRVQIRG
jgi:hypothetical protein